ncbi:hypothetical protein F5Y11DRAFT_107022 [Daldinia sp. FL1419]|nr:hypothetical protein F5Y11DRAFT_107022 [Daldinia sp. FL1419]
MSTSYRFCALCDVIVDPWLTPDDHLANPNDRLSWLQEVRALRAKRGVEDPYLTGAGWLDTHENVIAPVECDDCYYNYEPRPDLHHEFKTHKVGYPERDPVGYWCYVVHHACWELLRDRVDSNHTVPVNNLAGHLFTLLFNTPMSTDGISLIPGHAYGGASLFRPIEGELFSRYFTHVNMTDYSFITGDVNEALQHDEESLVDEVERFYAGLANYNTSPREYSGLDPFLCLPNELVILILTHLPSRDVCNLRLASRYSADLSSPKVLDQKFWASRFDADFEMGFVFAGPFNPRPTEPADWRALYLKSKGALRSELFHGFRNRHRIWHIFQHMTDGLYVRLKNESYLDGPSFCNLEAFPQRSVFAEAHFLSDNEHMMEPLYLSCRPFKRQDLLIPLPVDSTSQNLRASFVHSNGKTYISGFDLSTTDQRHRDSRRAGFVNPRNRYEISLVPQSSIEYIEVAMEAKGLIGLRLHIRGPQNSYSVSLGDMEPTEPWSGICRMAPGDNMQCIGFHFTLDACKIISISLLEQPVSISPFSIEPHTGSTPLRDHRPAEIWNPCIPAVYPEWHSHSPFAKQYFNLCFNIDFGGHDGRLLQSLVRVDMLMGKYPSVFTGVSFFYNDGSERFYGRKSFRSSVARNFDIPAIRQSFPIDGPGGEVITIVTAHYTSDTIQAITIATSQGREKQFCLYGKESREETEESRHVLQAEPGMCFTEFYAKIQSPLGHFLSFSTQQRIPKPAIQSFPLEHPNISHHIPITSETLSPAQDMLLHPRGFAITTADFSRLRRIRVSVGNIEGNSCLGHITGLWLEYHDSSQPVIVGQWINETGTFDIPLGDRISEVITLHDYTNPHKRVKYGPIRKIRLGTVQGINKEFPDYHNGGEIILEYRENPYETLSGILWGYNHEWDHVRTFWAPKPDRPNTQLLLGPTGFLLPSWSVVQRAFMEEMRKDGHPNPIVAIEVTFRQFTCEICGLNFVYGDGGHTILGIGVKGAQRVAIPSEERLVRMEIGSTRQGHILYINFLTTSGGKIDLSRENPERMSKRIVNRTVFILDRSHSGQPSIDGTIIRQVPREAGTLVGFWALPRRRGGLRSGRLGPVFEIVSEDRGLAD